MDTKTKTEQYPLRRLEVELAVRRRARVQEELLEALEDFLEAGGTYVELGRVLGVSRQAARQLVERGRRS